MKRLILLAGLVFVLVLSATTVMAQDDMSEDMGDMMAIERTEVTITSGDLDYPSFIAAPTEGGPYPAIVLMHSIRGLEEGYLTMTDQVAAQGFVVLALGWQEYEERPADDVVLTLLEDSITYLEGLDNVDAERIGLTGFCIGGRYTMLYLPRVERFGAGVAWYGFPYGGDPAPAEFVGDFEDPMLIIHGSADTPSPIADIYQYATELDAAGASYELKVYQGEPHGFILEAGQLRTDEVAVDAVNEMVEFFKRKL